MTSITVCIATMLRESVVDTLRSLDAQTGLDGVSLNIVVADNDEVTSAHQRISAAAADMKTPVIYVHAPARNISLARNAGLDAATGEWAAFIDDDEVAAPDWLAKLLAKAQSDQLDVVIGPALARYPADTPAWMEAQDYHSNRPTYRGGQVQTGHTCNALVHLTDPRIAKQRFLLSKGRSGGEDTEYFFRLWKMGFKLGAAEEALVYEPVNPARLNFKWIATRKFRAGQSYGYASMRTNTIGAKIPLLAMASAKTAFCGLLTAAFCWSRGRRNFWALRAIMHAGVVSSVFGLREPQIY